jgi:hypothetical protein
MSNSVKNSITEMVLGLGLPGVKFGIDGVEAMIDKCEMLEELGELDGMG